MDWIRKILALRRQDYSIDHLVQLRKYDHFDHFTKHIICDLDKTYLETRFETLAQLAKVAFEDAYDKQVVAGMPELLSTLRWEYVPRFNPQSQPDISIIDETPTHGPKAGLHFVSSSPTQLRNTIEEKLYLDGLDWDSITLKNQAYNLLKARADQLRQHIAYKTLSILTLFELLPKDADLILIGDNAESDPFIYKGLELYVSGKFSAKDFLEYLSLGFVDEQQIKKISSQLDKIKSCKISGIFIRLLENTTFQHIYPLTENIYTYHNTVELCLKMAHIDWLNPQFIREFFMVLHNEYGFSINFLRQEIKKFLLTDESKNLNPSLAKVLDLLQLELQELLNLPHADKIPDFIWKFNSQTIFAKIHSDKSETRPLERLSSEDILNQSRWWYSLIYAKK